MNKKLLRTDMPFKIVALIVMITIFLLFSKETTKGALEGLLFCGNVLIPSLFPFMVISTFVVKSGISDYLERFAKYITFPLFGVSGKCGMTVLLSMIGGYPVGAKGISALYESKQIDIDTAKKLAYFSVGAGPGFLITFVGTNLLGCPSVGVCILCSQILSVIILGFVNKYIFRNIKKNNSNLELSSKKISFAQAVVDSTISGIYSMINMCGMVILFSAILGVIGYLLKDYGNIFLYCEILLEVTNASTDTAENGNILLLAFATGFGGVCVHFQVFQALGEIEINKGIFFLYRIIQGLITCGFTFLFVKCFNVALPVYSSIKNSNFELSTSIAGSVMLIICGLCFLNTFKKYNH